MRRIKERRRSTAWKLRIYIDAIKDVEATTDEAWIDAWALHSTPDCPYMSRSTWISILKTWALTEANRLAEKDAA